MYRSIAEWEFIIRCLMDLFLAWKVFLSWSTKLFYKGCSLEKSLSGKISRGAMPAKYIKENDLVCEIGIIIMQLFCCILSQQASITNLLPFPMDLFAASSVIQIFSNEIKILYAKCTGRRIWLLKILWVGRYNLCVERSEYFCT